MDMLKVTELIITGMADLPIMIIKSVFESNVTPRIFIYSASVIEL